jgi:hypothetical protein
MKPWLAALVGAISGYAVLVLAVAWVRGLCLPLSSGEVKWQCAVTPWAMAVAYLAAMFIATCMARRTRLAAGVFAFALLFGGHMYLPHLALASLGPRWYLNYATLLFVLLPAALGSMAAVLLRKKTGRVKLS